MIELLVHITFVYNPEYSRSRTLATIRKFQFSLDDSVFDMERKVLKWIIDDRGYNVPEINDLKISIENNWSEH